MQSIDLSPGPWLVLLVIFVVALLIQLFYYLFTFLRLALYKPSAPGPLPPVSVVICARNEEENLREFLPVVLQQDYPDYEVIVVNDCSWDKSIDLLKDFSKQYRHLKIADIKEVEGREHGKKFALTIGIKAARNETLLLTDADCVPTGPSWISGMMAGYTSGKEIVLGYGKYAKHPDLLNLFIRYDAFFIAVQYLSLALRGKAYMGVGRNLSYRRHLFFQVKGFASHIHLDSGDDDLFINEVATPENVSVVIGKGTHTVSIPKTSWRKWFRQKKRHHSTAVHYKPAHKTPLLLYPLSWYLFYSTLITGLIAQYNLLILISGLFLRTCVQMIILHAAARKMEDTDLGWKAPLLEFMHGALVVPVYVICTFFARRRRWT